MRVAAIFLLCAAALFLLAGLLTGSWGDATEIDSLSDAESIRWGLMRVTVCDGGGIFFRSCESYSLHDYGWDQSSVNVALATFILGLLLVVMTVGSAVLTGLEKAFARIAGTATMSASAAALGSAAFFVILLPEKATDLAPELGSSFYLYLLGCITSVLGSSLCNRVAPRPARARASEREDGDELDPEIPTLPAHLSDSLAPGAPRGAMPSPVPIPPPDPMVPTCPSCRGDGAWMQQTQRFFCVRCNRYL